MDDLILRYLENGTIAVILSAGLTSQQTASYQSEGYNFFNSTLICNATTQRKVKLLDTLFDITPPLTPDALAEKLEAPIIAEPADLENPLHTTALNLAARYLTAAQFGPLLRRLADAGYRPGPLILQELVDHLSQNPYNSAGDIAELLVDFT